MRAAPDAFGHGGDDGRVRVPGDRGPVAAVHVDVLGAVDVVHLGTGAVTHPDRLRLRDLPVRGGPAGEVATCPIDEFGAARLTAEKGSLFLANQVVDHVSGRARTRPD